MSCCIDALPLPFLDKISVNTENMVDGSFSGRAASKADIKHGFCKSEQISKDTTSLSDRLIYPLKAVKKCILNYALLGSAAAGILAISLPAFLGSVIGSTLGGAVKLAKMMMGKESSAMPIGAVIGGMVGACLGAVASTPLVLFAITAFSVAGLVTSAFKLPVDVYYAIKLGDEDLDDYFNECIDSIEEQLAEPIWDEYEALKKAIAESEKGSGWLKVLACRYGIKISEQDYSASDGG